MLGELFTQVMNIACKHRWGFRRAWVFACGVWLTFVMGGVASDATYEVQPGDTLGAIAQKHGVTTRALQEHNDLSSPHRLAVGQTLRIPPGPNTPVKYVVRSGDTLGVIARNHGVTAQAIVTANELKNPDALRVGQVLLIPAVTRAPSSSLPPILVRDLDRIRVRRGWTHVVIHHSGTARGNVRDMDRYHREHRRMENGLGYHFVIGNGNGMGDGEIAIGQRWQRQLDGGHLASEAQNKYSIGICLVGNFEETQPTAKQMESLRELVRYLQRRSNIRTDRVTTHTQINVRPTRCPGRNFPTESFRRSL